MSLRTVALETPRLCRSTSDFEPIGSLVDDEVGDDGAQHLEPTVVGTTHGVHPPPQIRRPFYGDQQGHTPRAATCSRGGSAGCD